MGQREHGVPRARSGARRCLLRVSVRRICAIDDLRRTRHRRCVATLWSVRQHRPERRLPWILFALGNACFVVGDVITIFRPDDVSPAPADVAYLAGYPLLAAGLLTLMFAAGGRMRVPALADAGIVTFAFAIPQWVFVMGPAIQGGGNDLGASIVYGLYPAMDVRVARRLCSASSCRPHGERRRSATCSPPLRRSSSATRSPASPAPRTRPATRST